MKKTTLLFALLFAVTTAFKGGDKRETIKFDGALLSLLLTNNEATYTNASPKFNETAEHTWVRTSFENNNKIVLQSNQNVIDPAICKMEHYWFITDNKLKTSRSNHCKGDGNKIQIETQESYSYMVADKDAKTYLFLNDKSGKLAHKYVVESLVKVTYKKQKQTGYEITLVSQ